MSCAAKKWNLVIKKTYITLGFEFPSAEDMARFISFFLVRYADDIEGLQFEVIPVVKKEESEDKK